MKGTDRQLKDTQQDMMQFLAWSVSAYSYNAKDCIISFSFSFSLSLSLSLSLSSLSLFQYIYLYIYTFVCRLLVIVDFIST